MIVQINKEWSIMQQETEPRENIQLKRVKKQLEDMNNRISKFEGILGKTQTAGHKFEAEYKFIEQLKTTLITIGLQVQQLDRHSRAQHKRMIRIEEKLGLRKKKPKGGKDGQDNAGSSGSKPTESSS